MGIMSLAGCLASSWLLVDLLLALNYPTLGATQSFGRGYSLQEPDVPFPPACPSHQNIGAICQFGQSRPRYLPGFFPRSGFSHFRRRGNAINHLESWYSVCCRGNIAEQSNQVLCCAQQAWRQSLSEFCVDESSTKTAIYECCGKRGDERWSCFDSELPNPYYLPIPDYQAPQLPQGPGFVWNPNAC